MVPMNDAPLPKTSMTPKYSPDFSGGMILEKWERDSACTPPWKIPTMNARIQNSVSVVMNTANRVMNMYPVMHTRISFAESNLPDSLPNIMQQGNATICVSRRVINNDDEPNPRASP